MKIQLVLLFFIPGIAFSQNTLIKEGIPKDLGQNKLIFLKHERVEVTANPDSGKQQAYLYQRQINHNEVIEESNDKLRVATLEYPFAYVIATNSSYEPLVKAGYKYLLYSNAYHYENLTEQPEEGVLLVYEYFIRDLTSNLAYEVFEMTEMQIYDSKLMLKRLNKEIKRAFPTAFD